MDMLKVEKKWQTRWADEKLYSFDKSRIDKKYYTLEMFSYPSGAKLHAGHWYNYGPSDSFARFKRMQGYEVFEPMGFDAFGLPAENYAIRTGVHPEDSTLKNIDTMEKQLKKIGGMFDWDYEIKTCLPDYYKWTQWIFLELYKNGLAYRKEAPVNWCPSCSTVLANEQVLDGKCERCNSEVIKKNLTQWFFKITNYAEELLQDLDTLDWPQKTIAMQKNWIGKSVGGEVEFALENGETFRVFTTRADTLYGVSYVVLAPEHPLVDKLVTAEYKKAVAEYKESCAKTSEIDRLSSTREKSGVFIGAYAINPINNERVPIWIADYVLYSYGTGAVMGVPSHDERDFAFATKYNLPITRVIAETNGEGELPYCGQGVLVNSGEFNGIASEKAREGILDKLESIGKGGKKVNYRLRDWLVSRQRYWGCPIPIIHCEHCGEVPVPVEDLPVKLPHYVDFTPDGKSPLSKCDEFVNTVCPICGKPAKRDADTLDTFVCSSWYFLRYPDAHNTEKAFDSELINKMLPVDKYIGGAEHACMHLLYARFFTKALRDLGYLNFDEPFKSLVHQGTILGTDGMKMSKSRGNVVSPDDSVSRVGADAFRLYLMFGFSYVEGGPWNDNGIDSIVKFMDRVERIVNKIYGYPNGKTEYGREEKELNYLRHSTIKRVTDDMEVFSFNTAIARIMELVNGLVKYDQLNDKNVKLMRDTASDLIGLLAPLAPHFAEELNENIGNKKSIFNMPYPKYDESALVKDSYELAVQINSKVRSKIEVPSDSDDNAIVEIAMNNDAVKPFIDGKTVVKTIVIPKRLVNIVVK